MLHTFALKPATIETISPIHQHPAWEPLVTTHVATDKDEVAHIIRTRIDQVKVFTDGSGIHDHISTATVTYYGSTKLTASYKLGQHTNHTVFEGE